jgi:DNA-binding GntR family transcriptional regulator
MKPQRQDPSWVPVFNNLRDAILSHQLLPGTRLAEDELSNIYGLGRTVIRSALGALTHEGLLTHIPNRGVHVAKPTKTEARDVFEARSLVEPYIAELASGLATRDHIAVLKDHLAAEHRAVKAGDDSEAIALSAKFHLYIAHIANQSILTGFLEELISRSSLIVSLYWRRHDTICDCHAHDTLVTAIEQQDGQAAFKLMQSHLADLLSGLDLTERPAFVHQPLSETLGL